MRLTVVRYWEHGGNRLALDEIDDAFELFPLQSVLRHFSRLAEEAHESMAERTGPWGVSSKFRTVGDEHDVEVVENLLAAAFVLSQSAITQTVSSTTRIRSLANNSPRIPQGKYAIIATQSPIHAGTRISKITLIDSVANYVKHRHEWPDNWVGSSSDVQRRTIELVQKPGLKPGSEENLITAAREIGGSPYDLSPLLDVVQQWREQLVAFMRVQLNIPSRFTSS